MPIFIDFFLHDPTACIYNYYGIVCYLVKCVYANLDNSFVSCLSVDSNQSRLFTLSVIFKL